MLFNLFWHTRNNGNPSALPNDNFLNNFVYPGNEDPPEAASGGDLLGTPQLLANYTSYQYTDVSKKDIRTIASEVRDYLHDYYSIINKHNYGYQSGPDKNKRISRTFNTFDYQKSFR